MTEPIVLKGGGKLPTEETPWLRNEIYGLTGVGKSTMAATFPNPLWVCNFDRPWRKIIESLPETHEVHYLEIPIDVDMLIKGVAESHLLSFDKFLRSAEKSEDGGTFILDGGDVWWDVIKAAKLPSGTDGGDVPRDYYQANTYANSRYRRMTALPMHLNIISAARTKWASQSKETETLESEGFKHRLRWLTSQVRLFSPESRLTTPMIPMADAKAGRTFYGYVSLSKEKPEVEGTVEPNMTYMTLYRKIYRKNPPDSGKCWVPTW